MIKLRKDPPYINTFLNCLCYYSVTHCWKLPLCTLLVMETDFVNISFVFARIKRVNALLIFSIDTRTTDN